MFPTRGRVGALTGPFAIASAFPRRGCDARRSSWKWDCAEVLASTGLYKRAETQEKKRHSTDLHTTFHSEVKR